ncbi:MAG TPA: DUF4157 domain-containing protein, partial [Kofleriaceae bacterium]|nr:DUF4157 domain-containing protein [Kofleriaceae bacterium]
MSELEHSRRPGGSTTQDSAAAGNAAGNAAVPGKRSLMGGGAGRLDDATRSRMEGSFGVGFGDVNVHANSPKASGGTEAFTEGRDVHFAPGKYNPGSSNGNWLIAHELAHVVQQSGGGATQQRFNAAEPGLAHEAEADRAANAVVGGGKADVQLSTRSGTRQNYEAWEHRALADSGGGSNRTITVNCGITLTYGQVCALSGDFYRSPEALMNAPRAELEAILRTMDRERTQAGVTPGNNFGTGKPAPDQINQNNADYELATSSPGSRASHHDDDANPFMDDDDHAGGPDAAHPHGRVTQGNHVEDNGPAGGAAPTAEATFLGLADNNASHFSPENIALNFKPKHQLAIDLAKEAWRARNPTGTPGTASHPPGATGGSNGAQPQTQGGQNQNQGQAGQNQAGQGQGQGQPQGQGQSQGQGQGGQGAQGAQAVRPGAAVPTGAATPTAATVSTASGDAGERKEAMAYLSDGFAAHFLTDAFASGHLMSGSVGRTIGTTYYNAHAGAIRTALTSCLISDYPAALAVLGPGGVAATIAGMGAFISSKSGSLTLKLVHDYLNQHGVQVKNPMNTEWRTVGDANLASSGETQTQGSLAAQASREGVEKAVREGDLSAEERDKPLKYVPSEAKFASGAYQSISSFCTDATIFDAILSATMLSPDPNSNELWRMIKGNVGPMVALKIKQKQLETADLARRAGRTVAHGAQVVGEGIAHGAEVVGDATVR